MAHAEPTTPRTDDLRGLIAESERLTRRSAGLRQWHRELVARADELRQEVAELRIRSGAINRSIRSTPVEPVRRAA